MDVQEFDRLFKDFYGNPLTFTKQRRKRIYELAKMLVANPDNIDEERFVKKKAAFYFVSPRTIQRWLNEARGIILIIEELKERRDSERP